MNDNSYRYYLRFCWASWAIYFPAIADFTTDAPASPAYLTFSTGSLPSWSCINRIPIRMKPTVQTPRLLLVRQYGIVRFIIIRWFLKQMFHVAQSIVIIFAMCLPTTWRGCLFPNNRWGVFVGRGGFCAKQFMFCRWFIWVISEPNQGNPTNPQIPIGIVWNRVGCVLGIEPNEHRIPRFQGNLEA